MVFQSNYIKFQAQIVINVARLRSITVAASKLITQLKKETNTSPKVKWSQSKMES